jgi:hypothetical protein
VLSSQVALALWLAKALLLAFVVGMLLEILVLRCALGFED